MSDINSEWERISKDRHTQIAYDRTEVDILPTNEFGDTLLARKSRLLADYYKLEDDEVDKWIQEMFSA